MQKNDNKTLKLKDEGWERRNGGTEEGKSETRMHGRETQIGKKYCKMNKYQISNPKKATQLKDSKVKLLTDLTIDDPKTFLAW